MTVKLARKLSPRHIPKGLRNKKETVPHLYLGQLGERLRKRWERTACFQVNGHNLDFWFFLSKKEQYYNQATRR
jgi:hypothetical protein